MDTTESFARQIAAELEGKPFALDRTSDGFKVGFALADARWLSILQYNDVRDSITYTVRVDEKRGRFSINDTLRQIKWSGGASGLIPRFSFSFSRQSGRVKYGKVIQLGVMPGGFVASCSPEAERARIKQIGESLGLKSGLGRDALIGLWAAGGAIGLSVLGAGIVLLIMAFSR